MPENSDLDADQTTAPPPLPRHAGGATLKRGISDFLRRNSVPVVLGAVVLAPGALVSLPTASTLGALQRTEAVPVALIAQDGDLGSDITALLRESEDFSWKLSTEDTAVSGVRDGRFVAVVTINEGFSEAALTLGVDASLPHIEILLSDSAPELRDTLIAEVTAAVDDAARASPPGPTAEVPTAEEDGSAEVLDDIAAGLGEAQSRNATLLAALTELQRTLHDGGRTPNPAAIRAEGLAGDVASAAAAAASAARDALGTFDSSRALMQTEMAIQSIATADRARLLAIYDRLRSPLNGAVATADRAAADAGSLASSMRSLAAQLRGAEGSSDRAALAKIGEAREFAQELDVAFESAQTKLDAVPTPDSPIVVSGAGLTLTNVPVGPGGTLDAGRLAGLGALGLAIGALLLVPITTRLGRELAADQENGMLVAPHPMHSLLLAAAQGAVVGGVLATALTPGWTAAFLLVVFAAFAGITLVSIVQAAVLWGGSYGLRLCLGLFAVAWFLSPAAQPEQSLPTPLRWIDLALPHHWIESGLRYFSFGDPFAGGSALVAPLIVLGAVAVATYSLSEAALHARGSWAAARLADALQG
jgi:putative membrane protein